MASVDEVAREQTILASLMADGHVAVNELARRFGVSTVTVRKNLELLERRGLLRRVRGGAVSVGVSDEGAFEMRLQHSREAKMAIARAVAPLVRDGDVIALDSSTTSFYLGREIVGRRDLVVVTHCLRHAMLFMEHSSAQVLMPGGVIRRSSASIVGQIGDVLAGRGRIKSGFFGVVSVSTVHGLMDYSAEEAQAKRFLGAACDQSYGLFDSSKLTGFGLHSFLDVGQITGLYTDQGASPDQVAVWRERGVPLTVVPVDQHASHRDFTGNGGPPRRGPPRHPRPDGPRWDVGQTSGQG